MLPVLFGKRKRRKIVSGTTVGGSATLIELVFSGLVFAAAPGGSQFTTAANGSTTNTYDPSAEIIYDSGGDGTTNWVRFTLTNAIGTAGQALTVSFTAGFFTINVDGVTGPYTGVTNFPITNTIP